MGNDGTDHDEWASASAGHLTPADVQQKQFRTTRMGGGYRMRDVDEFLDQVTDTLSSLIAENERLRRGEGSGRSRAPQPIPSIAPADRAAIQAFLHREKDFLQSLGGLVQDHAEALKGMVRSSRAPAPASGTAPSTAPPAAAAPPATPAETRRAEPPSPAPPAAAESAPEEPAGPPEEPAHRSAEPMGEDEPVEVDASEVEELDDHETETGTIPTATAEEPIRLDEPAPARSRRPDEGTSGSLRELFWGEE
jgi:DivIVA domain-containing protein